MAIKIPQTVKLSLSVDDRLLWANLFACVEDSEEDGGADAFMMVPLCAPAFESQGVDFHRETIRLIAEEAAPIEDAEDQVATSKTVKVL